MRIIRALWATLLLSVLPGFAMAQSFSCISGNGACAQAESVVSWSLSGNTLTISNNPAAGNNSFIEGIYFDYAAPQTVSLSNQSAGVSFLAGGSPSNLPAGDTASFSTTNYWTSDLQGANKDGVDAGQWISFTLAGTSLANFANGTMQVGVHLQGLNGGISESLVTAVPEPESYAMLLAGLGLMGAVVSRRRRS